MWRSARASEMGRSCSFMPGALARGIERSRPVGFSRVEAMRTKEPFRGPMPALKIRHARSADGTSSQATPWRSSRGRWRISGAPSGVGRTAASPQGRKLTHRSECTPARRHRPRAAALLDFKLLQALLEEVVRVSDWPAVSFAEDFIAELLVEHRGLKAERLQKGVQATALDRDLLGRL